MTEPDLETLPTEETSTESPASAEDAQEKPPEVFDITGETSDSLSGVVVSGSTVLENTLTAAQAAEVLGVSARRVRQFVQEDRLDVARRKPLAVTRSSVEALAQDRSTSGTVAVPSASAGLQNLATIVDVLRSEHAATLAALEERVSAVAAHRDTLTEQVQDLRTALDRERERVAELAQQVENMTRRKWWKRG